MGLIDLFGLFIPDANPITAIGILVLVISILAFLFVPLFKLQSMLGIVAGAVLIFVPSIILNYLQTQEGMIVAGAGLIIFLFIYNERSKKSRGRK